MFKPAKLSDLKSFFCAHAQDEEAATGCTVIIAPEGAVCGVDVRGGGPASRETDLLRPENMVQEIHAVVLSGGSAFGLEASCGVMEELSARGIGFHLEGACVPIVTGACLFDLLVGKNAHPDAAMGRKATRCALENTEKILEEGNVGAGCGASVGKFLGAKRAMKTGFGMAGLAYQDLVCIALVAVNALGHIFDEKGRAIAGTLDDTGHIADTLEVFESYLDQSQDAGLSTNTTIGCILSNAQLNKAQATKVSSCIHDAYARAIKPVHTQNDGDTIFTLASGEISTSPDALAVLGAEAMQRAIERAALCAQAAYGLPSAQSLR